MGDCGVGARGNKALLEDSKCARQRLALCHDVWQWPALLCPTRAGRLALRVLGAGHEPDLLHQQTPDLVSGAVSGSVSLMLVLRWHTSHGLGRNTAEAYVTCVARLPSWPPLVVHVVGCLQTTFAEYEPAADQIEAPSLCLRRANC